MTPLVVLDADVLGRERTGDETYVQNLLRRLPEAAGGALRFAAVTRHPELVPEGVEPVALAARSQELRMAWTLPRLLRRLRPALAHFQHSLPLSLPLPGRRDRARPLVRARSARDAPRRPVRLSDGRPMARRGGRRACSRSPSARSAT